VRARRWAARIALSAAAVALLLAAFVAYGWYVDPAFLVVPLQRVACWRLGVERRSVEADGVRWPYLEAGPADGPPTVFLHGFGTSKEAMMTMLAHFAARGRRCVAPDMPGFGEHACHAGARQDGAFYAASVGAFMDAVGMRHATVVGTSMGGAVAAELAIDDPLRVDALLLLSPAGVEPPVRNAFMRRVDAGENPLDIADERAFDDVMRTVFLRPPTVPEPFRRWFVAEAVRRRPCTLAIVEAVKPFLEDGLRGRMAAIAGPTLVLYGAMDAVTDPSMRAVFAAEIPSCRTVVVPDAGHVAFSDNWPAVRREMESFLEGPAAPGGQR
jgi:pimeloyl-ACP methyl ester carboxylesterase